MSLNHVSLETSFSQRQEYDVLRPLAVHSYCLDMYAKASYHRLGRVDLDGLWYWREIEARPDAYGMGDRFPLRRPEVERARKRWDCPWHHLPGDEWLAANPVEIPGICRVLETCMNCANKAQAQLQQQHYLVCATGHGYGTTVSRYLIVLLWRTNRVRSTTSSMTCMKSCRIRSNR